jgi:hypothetical protein
MSNAEVKRNFLNSTPPLNHGKQTVKRKTNKTSYYYRIEIQQKAQTF